MIFLGDLACPEERIDDFISCTSQMQVFDNEVVVVNFEGVIVDDLSERKASSLYNISKIKDAFPQAEKVIVSLANNHMYDYPQKIIETKDYLEQNEIGTFGLIEDNKIKPYEYTDSNGNKTAFFGHCWRLYTKTNTNNENNVRVVDNKYSDFIQTVSEYIDKNPDVKVYCFIHWNYDLEVLPFPLLRKVSKELIDSGVESVIGSHSHVPQGIEIYKNKVIAYCLGNFYLPSGIFFNGTLNYPKESQKTYGIKFDGKNAFCVWFDTDISPVNEVICFNKTEAINGEIISEFSNCFNMTDKEYLEAFKNNRVNKLLVPVFGKYNSKAVTDFQESFAITRVKTIKAIHKLLKRDNA